MKLTAKHARQFLDYDADGGDFTWLVSRGRVKPGSKAGAVNSNGRIQIRIDGNFYMASRLAWLWMTGDWPPDGMEVDHKDCDPRNNRWSNLRLATRSQQECNVGRRSDNASGFKGVFFNNQKRRFQARIYANGKCKHLGYFDTAWRAYRAYCAAAKQHHNEYRRTV